MKREKTFRVSVIIGYVTLAISLLIMLAAIGELARAIQRHGFAGRKLTNYRPANPHLWRAGHDLLFLCGTAVALWRGRRRVMARHLSTSTTEKTTKTDPRYQVVYDRSFFGRLKIERELDMFRIPHELFPNSVRTIANYEIVKYEEKQGEKTVSVIYTADGQEVPIYQSRIYRGAPEEEECVHIHREYVSLVHGTTVHGLQQVGRERFDIAQALLPLGSANVLEASVTTVFGGAGNAMLYPGRDPLTYYHRLGPVGSMFSAWTGRNNQKAKSEHRRRLHRLGHGFVVFLWLARSKHDFLRDRQPRPPLGRAADLLQLHRFRQETRRRTSSSTMGDARIKLEQMMRIASLASCWWTPLVPTPSPPIC